ncbi:RNA polymerase sigma factor [Capnocytophaga sp. ARDL2]|uniref:RNA polymerase sigma factor n=1 Tax=Capnocytophaga sp. ARDL2 TaxID=3238809 RepID=UPI003556EF5E
MKNNILHLISDALKGDQTAYTKIHELYYKEVYLYILKKSMNEEEAHDISMLAFEKAFEKLNTYKSEYKFSTWLITIAKNFYIDSLKRKEKESFIEIENEDNVLINFAESDDCIEDELIYEQKLAELKQHIKELKPQYQQIIELRYFHEKSYQEIADIIDEPLNNVKVKLLRAKKL